MDPSTGLVWPARTTCTICGLVIQTISNYDPLWLSKYRVLYDEEANEPHMSGNIKVSGIGGNWQIISSDCIYFPRDYTKQVEFPTDYHRKTHGKVDLGTRTAHIFHDSCWTLLERSYAPLPVPLKDLHDTCRSKNLDPVKRLIDWGHKHLRDFRIPIPGGEDYEQYLGRFPELAHDGGSTRDLLPERRYPDPLGSVEARSWRVDDDMLRAIPSSMGEYNTVCVSRLGRLPPEIRDTIAQYLPARDVLSLGIACRPFLPVIYDELYHKRHFGPGGDGAWFFEADAFRREKGWTWTQLFHLTGRRSLSSLLPIFIRSKIWELIQFVQTEVSKFNASSKVSEANASSKRKYSSISGEAAPGTTIEKKQRRQRDNSSSK
ncbi:unnamed protein product [Clonostachys rhizophaga]|uniref:F-box domain-containing protein n=1 Tax=Clonostachys rhizophaga TaxID=160324 RepID=A0A9N9VRN5_9HYPO|nr:unnamed protein product [Clonostachys rhizophaga]